MQSEPTPRYEGPLPLAQALSAAPGELSDAAFTRDGPRADVEYRDLGLAPRPAAGSAPSTSAPSRLSEGDRLALARHDAATSSSCCKGWITFRYAGVDERRDSAAGGCLSQPAALRTTWSGARTISS